MKSPTTSPFDAARQQVDPPSHKKGPPVFLNDQVELDAAYTEIVYTANAPQVIKRFTGSKLLSIVKKKDIESTSST